VFTTLACGVLSQEEQLLTRFFEAARLYDTTIMAKYATVTFNPRTDGVVHDVEIERVDKIAEQFKVVTFRAQVRGPDGETVERTLHAAMRNQPDGWVITDIR